MKDKKFPLMVIIKQPPPPQKKNHGHSLIKIQACHYPDSFKPKTEY